MEGIKRDPAPPPEELSPYNGTHISAQFTTVVGETRFLMARIKNGRSRVWCLLCCCFATVEHFRT
eukprot:2021288-Lingulodinium_polyedra.AAC.1